MTETISIRVARPEDVEAIAGVLASSYPRLMAGAYDPDVIARATPLVVKPNPALLASGSYYLAIADGHGAIGCGGWTRERPGTGEIEPGLGHIRHFGVHADWTGRGVGRKLFDACVAQARAAGIAALESYSTLNGERFYAALGFKVVRPIEVPLGPDIVLPSILMRRTL